MDEPAVEWVLVCDWGRLGIKMWGDKAFVHCDISKWCPSIRRQANEKWEEFKECMRGRGIGVLYSYVPQSDRKVRKWQEIFGQKLVRRHSDFLLYMQEI